MSYEIKTIYQAILTGFEWGGPAHQGWYWKKETAERITEKGGWQNRVDEHEAIVMNDGDVLVAHSSEVPSPENPHRTIMKTIIQNVRVFGHHDQDIRAAALLRLPDLWKQVLGLPHDEEVAATQSFRWKDATPEQMRNKLLILDIAKEEARVLGLGEVQVEAIRMLEEAQDLAEERKKQLKIDHPLIGTKIKMPARASYSPHTVYPHDFRVSGLAPEAEDGETQYHCEVDTFSGTHPDDKKKIWRRSEIEAANPETEKPS